MPSHLAWLLVVLGKFDRLSNFGLCTALVLRWILRKNFENVAIESISGNYALRWQRLFCIVC